jgi:hypothetical protein
MGWVQSSSTKKKPHIKMRGYTEIHYYNNHSKGKALAGIPGPTIVLK